MSYNINSAASGFGSAAIGKEPPPNAFSDKVDGKAVRERANFLIGQLGNKDVGKVGDDGTITAEQLQAIQKGIENTINTLDKGNAAQQKTDHDQGQFFQDLTKIKY